MNPSNQNNRNTPDWMLLVQQLLLLGLVLCVFALFHHVIPDWKTRSQGAVEPIGRVAPVQTPAQRAEEMPVSEEPEQGSEAQREEQQATVPETPAEDSEEDQAPQTWQERFAEHFSPQPRWHVDSYSSPNLSITVTEYAHTDQYPRLTFYVADCYVSDLSSLRCGFPAEGTYASGESIAEANGAILAVNGDSMLTQHTGFLVRNGDLYSDLPTQADLCVLYGDGVMETYGPGSYTVEEILAGGPVHCWQFGPALLDECGQPLDEFNISYELQSHHPRTALGYYEPGHYCFVVVDGRDPSHSDGAELYTLAQIMSDLGCLRAYNMDGGASSMMIFHGSAVNSPSKSGMSQENRYISDMMILVEPAEEEP